MVNALLCLVWVKMLEYHTKYISILWIFLPRHSPPFVFSIMALVHNHMKIMLTTLKLNSKTPRCYFHNWKTSVNVKIIHKMRIIRLFRAYTRSDLKLVFFYAMQCVDVVGNACIQLILLVLPQPHLSLLVSLRGLLFIHTADILFHDNKKNDVMQWNKKSICF